MSTKKEAGRNSSITYVTSEKEKEELDEISRIKAPIDTALLDDISYGIREIIKKFEAQVPEGVTDQAVVSVAGATPVPMQPSETDPPWFRATVYNDGPSPVYVSLNEPLTPSQKHAPLNMGDVLEIDTVEAKIKSLWFANLNATDTSSCRVYLLQ